ncbi:hypothetical protein HDU76_008929, partial [Blyttiomyces sp. JEL0837]
MSDTEDSTEAQLRRDLREKDRAVREIEATAARLREKDGALEAMAARVRELEAARG